MADLCVLISAAHQFYLVLKHRPVPQVTIFSINPPSTQSPNVRPHAGQYFSCAFCNILTQLLTVFRDTQEWSPSARPIAGHQTLLRPARKNATTLSRLTTSNENGSLQSMVCWKLDCGDSACSRAILVTSHLFIFTCFGQIEPP